MAKNEPQKLKEYLFSAMKEAVRLDEEQRKRLAHFKSKNGKDIFSSRRNAFQRQRIMSELDVVTYLHAMEGGSLQKELYLLNPAVKAPAFVQQRKKIPFEVFEDTFNGFNLSCLKDFYDLYNYHGYRVFAIDGTAVNMARNPKAASYMKPTQSNPKGYNQLHVNALYDVLNHTYFGCEIQPQPKMDEVGALYVFMELGNIDLPNNSIIVADRGYESYNAFATFLEHNKTSDKKAYFLIRVKQNRTAMREVAKLPMTALDTDISFTITTTQTNEDKANDYIHIQQFKNKKTPEKTSRSRWTFYSPYHMTLRIVRFQLATGEYETLATNLPREEFSPNHIQDLYHMRWGIETAFRELKYGLGLVHLHGKSDDFVKQEIYAALTMANFCSRIAHQVMLDQNESNKLDYQVNMTRAIDLCRKFFRAPDADGEQLLRDIARYTEPVRLGRQDKRNLKAKSFVGFTYRVS